MANLTAVSDIVITAITKKRHFNLDRERPEEPISPEMVFSKDIEGLVPPGGSSACGGCP
jgi:hypothetical protein